MSRKLNYTVVDAFTSEIFSGNPAAVIVFPEDVQLDEKTLQLIAREFNLSETAFVSGLKSNFNGLDAKAVTLGLRWFAPRSESAICGHATLATAHVLFSSTLHLLSPNITHIKFETLSGTLTASRLIDTNEPNQIALEFPAGLTTPVDTALAERAKNAVVHAVGGIAPEVVYVGVGEGVSYGNYMIIELAAAQGPTHHYDLANADIQPDAFLSLAPAHEVITLTTLPSSSDSTLHSADFKSKSDFDYLARVFVPNSGIPEDPVTGSAHCLLTPYWAVKMNRRDISKSAENNLEDYDQSVPSARMRAKQVSKRGGVLDVTWDKKKGVCRLEGAAVTAAEGVLYF